MILNTSPAQLAEPPFGPVSAAGTLTEPGRLTPAPKNITHQININLFL
jgi:hypothetical protein